MSHVEDIEASLKLLSLTCPASEVYLPDEDYNALLGRLAEYVQFVVREDPDPALAALIGHCPDHLRQGISYLGLKVHPKSALRPKKQRNELAEMLGNV